MGTTALANRTSHGAFQRRQSKPTWNIKDDDDDDRKLWKPAIPDPPSGLFSRPKTPTATLSSHGSHPPLINPPSNSPRSRMDENPALQRKNVHRQFDISSSIQTVLHH